jgi:hypothetical protein
MPTIVLLLLAALLLGARTAEPTFTAAGPTPRDNFAAQLEALTAQLRAHIQTVRAGAGMLAQASEQRTATG